MLSVCAGLAGTAAAQAVRGTLLGAVQDAQGAPVPGVTVTATETQTNVSRSVVTNQSNAFNHANFLNPNGQFGQATFGQVTATNGSYTPRLVRLGARVIF